MQERVRSGLSPFDPQGRDTVAVVLTGIINAGSTSPSPGFRRDPRCGTAALSKAGGEGSTDLETRDSRPHSSGDFEHPMAPPSPRLGQSASYEGCSGSDRMSGPPGGSAARAEPASCPGRCWQLSGRTDLKHQPDERPSKPTLSNAGLSLGPAGQLRPGAPGTEPQLEGGELVRVGGTPVPLRSGFSSLASSPHLPFQILPSEHASTATARSPEPQLRAAFHPCTDPLRTTRITGRVPPPRPRPSTATTALR